MALLNLVKTQAPVAGQADLPNLAALRSYTGHRVGLVLRIQEHSTGLGYGGGEFECVSVNSAGYVDDNGYQIITSDGAVYRRLNCTYLCSDLFGAAGGQDIAPVMANMFKASRTSKIQDVYVCHPRNGLAYTHSGGNVFDISDGIGFYVHGLILGRKGVPVNHIGDSNICMRFRMDQPNTTSFYERAGCFGLLIRGRTTDNSAAGNAGFAVQVSDIRGFECDLFITGYTDTSGAAISLYNETGFTELSKIKAMVRGCCNGVLFHRYVGAGYTSTNSFMGTDIELDYQAGVAGKANAAIRVQNIDGGTSSNTFDLNLYASTIKLKYWAEAGSSTYGIVVGAKAIIPESTVVTMISDGYGFGSSDTDTTTSPATILIRVQDGGIFRGKCMDLSMQTGLSHRLNQLQRLRNSIFSFQDDIYKVPYTDARPYINPVGMSCICSGTIDAATQQAGASWQISGLPMGMRIKVTINQYLEGESATSVQEVWEVLVRGDAQSVICTPLVTNDVLTTTSGLAVVNSAFATATFLKSVTAAFGRFWQGDSARTRLTVRNNNDDNSLTTGSSDGRKFRIFLPANPSASSVLHYSVKLEVL